jgi:hypothetical protein
MNEIAKKAAERGPSFDEQAKVIQVIETTLFRKGAGTPESPLRCVTQYWTLDGKLLAEVDPVQESRGTRPTARLSSDG